jgi:hypothetical protein
MKVRWKPFWAQNEDGSIYRYEAHMLNYEPTLIHRIMRMPKGKPISLDRAYTLYQLDAISDLGENGTAFFDRLGEDWIRWIEEMGYQIILTGDEFDLIGAVVS